MSRIEQEIQEVMTDHQATGLARVLRDQVRQLPPPDAEEGEAISRILQNVTGDLPVYQAMWIAFWLGCAWQNLIDSKQDRKET